MGTDRKSACEDEPRTALPPLDRLRPEHVAYVRTLVSKLSVSPAHQREDLVQEVLIQAHRSRHSALEPRALLFGITRHVVYRWISAHQQEQAALASHEHHVADQEAHPSVEDEWQAAERRDVVRASIDELPDIFRDVFVRIEVEEMSMPEAAKDLGIPINTGYTRLHLARARFSELLRRVLARRRIEKEDLAVPVLIAAPSSDAPFASPSRAPPSSASPAQGPSSTPTPSTPAPSAHVAPSVSWWTRVPWGAPELFLLGAAVTVSVAVRSPDGALPAMPEPSVVTASSVATSLPEAPASQPPDAPLERPSASPSPPDPSPPPPQEPSPSPSSPAPSTRPRPTPSSAPRPTATARSDGAWARDIARLALAGDRARAVAELAAFRRAHPNSTYVTRLEAMVAGAQGQAIDVAPPPAPPVTKAKAPE